MKESEKRRKEVVVGGLGGGDTEAVEPSPALSLPPLLLRVETHPSGGAADISAKQLLLFGLRRLRHPTDGGQRLGVRPQ